MSIDALLDGLRAQVLPGPDGPLVLETRPPPSPEALAAFHATMPLPLTGSYAALLTRSDGLILFGVPIFGTSPPPETNPENVADLVRRRLVPIHDWGNGDFDCLDLTKVVDAEPPVVFWNDEHENLFAISHSFAKWVPMAVHEVSRFGRLLHPRDYMDSRYEDAQGLYESIANVRKTFFGGPEIPDRPPDPPAPGRRERLRSWIGAKLRR
jgi:hypothetical protein